MAILFISHKYPPAIGGMEKQSYELISRFGKYSTTYFIVYTGKGSKFLFFLQLRSKVKQALKDHPEISCIHLNDGLMAAFTPWLKKLTSIPVFVTFHGLDITYPLSFYQKVVIPRIAKLDGFICVSTFTRDEALNRGFPPEKLHIISNGVDHNLYENDVIFTQSSVESLRNKYNIDQEAIILISIGRPVQRKGFSWFISKVMSKFNSEKIVFIRIGDHSPPGLIDRIVYFLPVRLRKDLQLMFGLSSDTININKAIKRLRPNTKVIQVGKVRMEEANDLLKLADLYIMPNIHVNGDCEGFGLVALEASIMRKFVLASDLEGIKDALVQGKNGLKIPAGDADIWHTSIKRLIKNKFILREMGENGALYTKDHFSWDDMVKEYFQVLPLASKTKKNAGELLPTLKALPL